MAVQISNVSLVTLYCKDQDEAKKFYLEELGFIEKADVSMGNGFRWVTIAHPAQEELQITLMVPGPPLDDDMAAAVSRALDKGTMGGLGLRVTDCRKTYEELSARGIEFPQPPSDRPYGVEAVMRDVSGNWMVLVQPKEFEPGAGEWGPEA